MIVLELHTIHDVPFTVNMSKVESFESDGAGHTKMFYTDESWRQAKESYEEVREMLHVALIGNRGVVSLADIAAVVR